MTNQEIEAVVGGYHGDPFGVLGSHPVSEKDGAKGADQWEIRAFLPHANEVAVLTAGQTVPMERIHPAGLFVARFPSKPGAYKFKLTGSDGKSYEMEDVYRFPPVVCDFDLHLFLEGTNYEAYNALGAHVATVEGVTGTRFAVWAPNALVVSVVGDFNGWDTRQNPMRAARGRRVGDLYSGCRPGKLYKYSVKSRLRGYTQMKADPYGFATEVHRKSASVVADLDTYNGRTKNGWQKRAETESARSARCRSTKCMRARGRKNEDGTPLTYRAAGHRACRLRQRDWATRISS